MLLELRVENYAVIDGVAVEFGPGLNLLTGETGAGKSILIDALALLLGEKASTDVIRHGAEKAIVSAIFEASGSRALKILEENGIDSDTSEIILKREILANGKGRVFINNQPATVAVLKQLAPEIATVHAQNESILGFGPASRLALLDAYAGISTSDVEQAFSRWSEIRSRIADLEQNEQDKLRLVDLWSFQKKEIESAHLEAGEDERLESEKRVLANAEKVRAAAVSAFELLYENDASAVSNLKAAARQVEELSRYDAAFGEQAKNLEALRASVDDIAATLRDYMEKVDASPERLTEVEDRLALIDRLKRKYGSTLDEVIAFGSEVARKLNEVENKDEVLAQLRKELKQAADQFLTAARSISQRRKAAAKKLEKLVEEQVNDLAMKATFAVKVEAREAEQHWSVTGFDEAAYLIATNVGEPMAPIENIASGGEMSRVMLALKTSIEEGARTHAKSNGKGKAQRTLIFDEIDTGIGGRAAEAVGKKLKTLARSQQVLCVTHLPQVASFADRHYVIEKREAAGRTRTSIHLLDNTERTKEIARMLSGAKLTDTSLQHAEQMLKANA